MLGIKKTHVYLPEGLHNWLGHLGGLCLPFEMPTEDWFYCYNSLTEREIFLYQMRTSVHLNQYSLYFCQTALTNDSTASPFPFHLTGIHGLEQVVTGRHSV